MTMGAYNNYFRPST